MICPNCQNEVKENAKFCTKCGYHLAPAVEAVNEKEQQAVTVCKNCGAALKSGAKFCVKCGTPVGAAGASQLPKAKPVSKDKPKPKTDEKQMSGLILFLVILLLILIVAGIVGVLMWKETIPAPDVITEKTESVTDETDFETVVSESAEMAAETTEPTIDTDTLFAETDVLVETAQEQMYNDAEIITAMDNLASAASEYAQKAEEAGDASLAADRIADTYEAYIEAVDRHKNMMNASTLSGAIYAQIMSELNAAIELGEKLTDKGYEIDISSVKQSMDEFDKSYHERIIAAFDEFTTREAWSRTEAWNLMKDTDSMYDSGDLDDPIRLRYCYALSWWTQKQIETELASGTITEKGAAIKIAGLLEAMDYSPMMVNYYIQYMSAAGDGCDSVVTAYNEIVEHIKDTQGIELGRDIDLAHFWYYNDVSNPADGVQNGTVNGVTQENREWIRSRMRYAEFENQ